MTERPIISDYFVTVETDAKGAITATCDGFPEIVENGKDRGKVLAAIAPRIEAEHEKYRQRMAEREAAGSK